MRLAEHLRQTSVVYALLLVFGLLLKTHANPIQDVSIKPREEPVKLYEGSAPGKLTDNDNGGPGGPDLTDYPHDADIEAVYHAPAGPFVFFSNIGSSDPPYKFAQSLSPKGAILRGAFGDGSYLSRGRDPTRSKQWFQDFASRMSGIFTDKAVARGDRVYFVGRFDAEVDPCRTWARIELPTLVKGGIKITLVDYTNFNNQKDYPIPIGLLGKRAAPKYCFDWLGNGEDPATPGIGEPLGAPYFAGACGVHVTQFQRNEGPPGSGGGNVNYRFSVTIKDAVGEQIGQELLETDPPGKGIGVDSRLPLVLTVQAGSADSDPVKFAYGAQSWTSNSAQCSVGSYSSGSRQMDCGFTCPKPNGLPGDP